MKMNHRWMESLEDAIRGNEDARKWAPRLLLVGVLTSIPSLCLIMTYGFGDSTLTKFTRYLLLVPPITGLGTGSMYLVARGIRGALLVLPIEGEHGYLQRKLERALDSAFDDMGLEHSKGPGRPGSRSTYKLPQGILVQILASGAGGEEYDEPNTLGVRVYGVREGNRSLATKVVQGVDGRRFWEQIEDQTRSDIMEGPGYWEH